MDKNMMDGDVEVKDAPKRKKQIVRMTEVTARQIVKIIDVVLMEDPTPRKIIVGSDFCKTEYHITLETMPFTMESLGYTRID